MKQLDQMTNDELQTAYDDLMFGDAQGELSQIGQMRLSAIEDEVSFREDNPSVSGRVSDE